MPRPHRQGRRLRPEELAGRPDAFPHDATAAEGVEWVQTHLSHVFLTGARVYKFRKPVDLSFVRFATASERNADCLREVELNRRLAPDVYLGVAPLEADAAGRARVGAVSDALAGPGEHCVVMRRLPTGRDACSLLEKGGLPAEWVEALAARIARFHAQARLGRPAPFDASEWRERCTAPVDENFVHLAEAPRSAVDPGRLERTREAARRFASAAEERFERRRLAGRAVDAHGDLHLQHVWFERDAADPVIIDCLEFSERLRHIDAASEVAFTAMDLAYRGREDLAGRFLRCYAREADDFDLYGVVDYFVSYRAAVRAKVAALAAADPAIEASQREAAGRSAARHLVSAESALEPRGAGGLVLVGGKVGAGKTTASNLLADAADGVVVSTDRVRKQLAGLAVTDRGSDAELYTPEARERTYEAVLERAGPIVGSGRLAILDATWGRRADRDRARAWAAERGVRCTLVEIRSTRQRSLERLARRSEAGRDASDVGPDLYDALVRDFEEIAEEEGARLLHTDASDWGEAAAALGREIAG